VRHQSYPQLGIGRQKTTLPSTGYAPRTDIASGNDRMTSRQSPSYNVHSDMEPLPVHDPSVLTVRGSRAGVLTVAVQTVPTRIAEIAALGVGFVFPKEPKTRLVVMLSSHGSQPFAYPGHRKTRRISDGLWGVRVPSGGRRGTRTHLRSAHFGVNGRRNLCRPKKSPPSTEHNAQERREGCNNV